jgi:hypothetical protein
MIAWVTAYLLLGITEASAELDVYSMSMGCILLITSIIALRVLVFLIACCIEEIRSQNERP